MRNTVNKGRGGVRAKATNEEQRNNKNYNQ